MRNLSEIQTIKTLPTTYLGMYASGSHWGMQANGNTSSWIRTTSNGIIPFEAGGASSLGTTDWPFNSIYSKRIYENGVDISTKYLPLAGGTMTGDLKFSSNGDTGERGIMGNMGANDVWRIFGGATARDTGYLEIATGDNGNEPIYFKQYEATTTGWTNPRSTVTLLDANGNSNFSGSLKAKALNSASTIKCAESIYVGDGSNGERSICFYSADGSYKCKIYGGNTNSSVAFGIYDSNASIRVLAYTPDTNTTLMQTDIVKMSGKLEVKEITCSTKMTFNNKAVLTTGNVNKNITIGTNAPSNPSTGDIWISW